MDVNNRNNLSVALAFSPNRMTQVSDFDALEPQERAKWIEWLVAQELFRRQCIAGIEDPEAIWYWASKEHEIDFVDAGENLYEVKSRRSGPLDFVWFAKSLPKRKVLAIGSGEFQSAVVKGITIEQFLLADGLPRRLGFLLDLAGHEEQACALKPFAKKAKTATPLNPGTKPLVASPAKVSEKNSRWKLLINESVEIDS
jgi:hypothetical protein